MAERSSLHDVTAAAGAVFFETGGWHLPGHFGDPEREYRQAREGAAVFDLSGGGPVEAAGKDAATFLHNLCTNDVKGQPEGTAREAFLTTAKARVVAHFFVNRLRHGGREVFWLDTVPGMAAKVLQQLDRYLISEQVELADRTAEFARLAVIGPRAVEALAGTLAAPLPGLEELGVASAPLKGGGEGVVRRRGLAGLPAFDLFCPTATAGAAWRSLTDAGAAPAGSQAYEVLRVEAGLPAYGPDIDEDRLVMEVGRTKQAVSYTKGCFLGQEPIVMARDRGHVNRTLLGLKLLDGGGPVPTGSRVLHNGQEVGETRSSARSPRLGATVALAYLKRGSQEPGTVVELAAEGGPRRAEVTALPFL